MNRLKQRAARRDSDGQGVSSGSPGQLVSSSSLVLGATTLSRRRRPNRRPAAERLVRRGMREGSDEVGRLGVRARIGAGSKGIQASAKRGCVDCKTKASMDTTNLGSKCKGWYWKVTTTPRSTGSKRECGGQTNIGSGASWWSNLASE